MKYKHLTWYLLADGTHADPNDCAPGADGVLRHKDGLAVALRGDGVPQSIGVDAVDNKNVEAAKLGEPDPNTQDRAVAKSETHSDSALLAETTDPLASVVEKEVLTDTPSPVAKNREMKTSPAKKARAKRG